MRNVFSFLVEGNARAKASQHCNRYILKSNEYFFKMMKLIQDILVKAYNKTSLRYHSTLYIENISQHLTSYINNFPEITASTLKENIAVISKRTASRALLTACRQFAQKGEEYRFSGNGTPFNYSIRF